MSIYLDNAATSWPKPPSVAEAITRFLTEIGGNPGRSGHSKSVEAGRVVLRAREALADLVGCRDPLRVVFGSNATAGLNLALHGLLRCGDHVVTSSMEHNSVMRPLRHLAGSGVKLTVVEAGQDGSLDPARLEDAILPETKLIALNHASNVVGTVLPVREAGDIARRHGLLLLVDAAVTAGILPIDMEKDKIDLLAFTGHKALYGPMGTGGLAVGPHIEDGRLRPQRQGGTGSLSEKEEQPAFFPDAYESGSLNAPGLAGLIAGIEWIESRGVEALRSRQIRRVQGLIDALDAIDGVRVYGTRDARRQMAAVAFNIVGMDPAAASLALDDEFGVLCRMGLHCSPAAHRTLGSWPEGTLRFAASYFTTDEELAIAADGVATLARRARA